MVTYLTALAVLEGMLFLILILAAGAHLDYKDKESAGNVKMVLLLMAAMLVWPLTFAAAACYCAYALVVGIWSAFHV